MLSGTHEPVAYFCHPGYFQCSHPVIGPYISTEVEWIFRTLSTGSWISITKSPSFDSDGSGSLANMSYTLPNFFTSHGLVFLLVTETLLSVGELSPLSELVPQNCNIFSLPRTSGHSGGLATILRSSFNCQRLSSESHSSFKLQLFQMNLDCPGLFAVIYQSLKFIKDFIYEFSDFLAGIMPKYNRILILGNFNIHICFFPSLTKTLFTLMSWRISICNRALRT